MISLGGHADAHHLLGVPEEVTEVGVVVEGVIPQGVILLGVVRRSLNLDVGRRDVLKDNKKK